MSSLCINIYWLDWATHFSNLTAYTLNDVWIVGNIGRICCDEAARVLRKHFARWFNVAIVEIRHAKLPDLRHWLSLMLEQTFVLKLIVESIKLQERHWYQPPLDANKQDDLPSWYCVGSVDLWVCGWREVSSCTPCSTWCLTRNGRTRESWSFDINAAAVIWISCQWLNIVHVLDTLPV